MRLWMLTGPDALDTLDRRGVLIADGRRAWREMRPAYRWMADQMAARIGPPPRPGAYPLWAWAQWQGPRQPKPDMRSVRHTMADREWPCYRLTLEMPAEDVLLSDFEDWHFVLNGWFLSLTKAEDAAFDADREARGIPHGWPYPEPFHTRIVQSWQRIFDLERPGIDEGWRGSRDEQSLQATFWTVERHHLRKVECFPRIRSPHPDGRHEVLVNGRC